MGINPMSNAPDPKPDPNDVVRGAMPDQNTGDSSGSTSNSGGQSTADNSWFNEATQFFGGKKTSMVPTDELGQELWKAAKSSQQIAREKADLSKQIEEYSAYKDDLTWLLSDQQVAQYVRAKLQGGNPQQPNNQGFGNYGQNQLPPEINEKLGTMEQALSMTLDNTISNNFNNHLQTLSKQYPDADLEEVKQLATLTQAIYDPNAPKLIEDMVKANAEKYQNLRKKFSGQTINDMRGNQGAIPSGTPTGGVQQSKSFRDSFEEAYKVHGF